MVRLSRVESRGAAAAAALVAFELPPPPPPPKFWKLGHLSFEQHTVCMRSAHSLRANQTANYCAHDALAAVPKCAARAFSSSPVASSTCFYLLLLGRPLSRLRLVSGSVSLVALGSAMPLRARSSPVRRATSSKCAPSTRTDAASEPQTFDGLTPRQVRFRSRLVDAQLWSRPLCGRLLMVFTFAFAFADEGNSKGKALG